MAARIEAAPHTNSPQLVDLRQLRAADLEALLKEEIETWRKTLDWDFSKSADLVRRFVDLRALNGSALLIGDEVGGYTYFVLEEHKGLIGDLYLRRRFHTPEREASLLESVVNVLLEPGRLRRVESQLMMIRTAAEYSLPGARFLSTYERNFMRLDFWLTPPPGTPRRPSRQRIFLERWSDQYQEPAAQLIAASYEGHVDSQINDQYRSLAGARRFLYNIVQYPGCGTFYQPASFAAFDTHSGRICGMCLSSMVAPGCGHVTQVCVAPWVRGKGVGFELMRQALQTLAECGCTKVSLTVTASNAEAIVLYEALGFRTVHRFSAHVWEGF
jgi:ribosomal protein S18 acetylase RimI-like enzyme